MSGRLVARYYDPRFGRFLQQDPLPDVVEQARQKTVAAFRYEALAGMPAAWTSPEFEAREASFEQIVNAGAVMNRLRQFDWMREEINPGATTGIAAGNQAGAAARKESTSTRPKSFTGGMSGGGLSLESVTPRLAAIGPGQALDPDDLNLYAYMAGNPFAGTDPDGREGLWDKAKSWARKGVSALTGETSAGDLARGAVDAGGNAVKAAAEWLDQHPRAAAVVEAAPAIGQMAFGGAEMVAGTFMALGASPTVIGAVGGGLLAAHGADNWAAGVRALATGKAQATVAQSLLEGASESLTGERTYGTIAAIGLDLAAGGFAARGLAKAGGLLRASGETELRFGASVGRFRNQPGYAQNEISGRWYSVSKRERLLEQRLSVHGNLRTSETGATLYAKFDKEGKFLKWGITEDPATRYSSTELKGGFLIQYRRGPRSAILDRERRLVERFPGPENKEPWAGWTNPSHPNYRPKRALTGVDE